MQAKSLRRFAVVASTAMLIGGTATASEISDRYMIGSHTFQPENQVAASTPLNAPSPFSDGGWLSRAPTAVSADGMWETQVSQQNGVTITGRDGSKRLAPWFAFSLIYAYTWGQAATQVVQDFGGGSINTFDGDDVDIGHSAINLNIRVALRALANVANIANLANAAVANGGAPLCVLGLEAAFAIGGRSRAFRRALHGALIDTYITARTVATLFPYIGCTAFRVANNYGLLMLRAGPYVSIRNIELNSDETQGGGVPERGARTAARLGGAIGFDYKHRLPNTLGLAAAGLHVGFLAAYNPALRVGAQSSTFSFLYTASVLSAWYYTARFGLFAAF